MAFISKANILAAYKKLSEMFPDPDAQGATQKVSAIRHFVALDRFYKLHGSPCDTRNRQDKDEFAKLVGLTSDVCLDLYTTNFYYPLKKHSGDYCVGSNFYSAGQVSASLVNQQGIFDYPKRGGIPLFKVQNGKLIRDVSLYENFRNYITSTEYIVAFVVWIIRKIDVRINNGNTTCQNVKNTLSDVFTDDLISVLFNDQANFERILEEYGLSFNDNFYSIRDNDIKELFDNLTSKTNMQLYSRQIIYYGAPGTGKSYAVKRITGEMDGGEKENVFRTTFHPDTDYASFVGCYKPAMKDVPEKYRAVAGHDTEISYEFVPQVFTEAYVYAYEHRDETAYLVIEEINRGNCAQIFGDLFQLLDRNEEGVSEYAIRADMDLKKHLESVLGKDSEGIRGGKLRLPENLHILATMNTSDQSLFPMDSAFKRRWDWQYVPISYTEEKSSQFEIDIDGEKYSWVEFIKAVNKKIVKITQSEDKQMGNFFIKSSVNAEQFKSKVMFYLWNEVLRDEVENSNYFFYSDKSANEDNKFTFKDLYEPTANETLKGFMAYLEITAQE